MNNKALSLLLALATLATVAEAHIYRDHWMRKNNIDPDYMHYKAMQARSHAAVVEAKLEAGALTREWNFDEKLNK